MTGAEIAAIRTCGWQPAPDLHFNVVRNFSTCSPRGFYATSTKPTYPWGKQRREKASTVKRIMYSAAALLSAGAVVIPTTAASAAPTPQPPRVPTIHVTEFGNRAVEVRGFMVSVGQVTRFIPAADFA
jgi:hypothetical protein